MCKRIFAFILLCLLLCSAFPACASGKSKVQRKVDGILISLPYEFSETPNPFYAESLGDLALLSMLTETYFDTSGIASLACEEQDGLYIVTVKITQAIQYSNRLPVTARDLMQAIDLVVDPSYDGPYQALGRSSLVGLKAYQSGQKTTVEGVRKIDNYTLQLSFEAEEDYESLLDLPVVNANEYGTLIFNKCSSNELVTAYAKIVGTGPFYVNGRLEPAAKSVTLAQNTYNNRSVYRQTELTLCSVADSDVGVNIKMGQLTGGFVSDRASAKAQADQYGLSMIALQDGYLLLGSEKGLSKVLGAENTVLQAIDVILKKWK